MQNVGMVYVVKCVVIDGELLIECVVIFIGEVVIRLGNVWVCFGMLVCYLLNDVGFCFSVELMVIMGGLLMGFILLWFDVLVVKIINCLLVFFVSEMGELQEEKGCICCSVCVDVCLVDLLLQQLYWFSKGQQYDKVIVYNLVDCIECGVCVWVCLSNILLVQYFCQEKVEIVVICQEEQCVVEVKV